MTEKQKDLDRRVSFSLDFLNSCIENLKDDNGDLIKFYKSAKAAFEELHEDWRSKCGSPKYINSQTTANILKILAHVVEKYGLQLKQEGAEEIGVKWHDEIFYKWVEDMPPDVEMILKKQGLFDDI